MKVWREKKRKERKINCIFVFLSFERKEREIKKTVFSSGREKKGKLKMYNYILIFNRPYFYLFFVNKETMTNFFVLGAPY